MTHSYKISNMTCSGCIAKVKSQLLKNPDVLSAEVNLPDEAIITMQKHISIQALQQSIGADSKYKISENEGDQSLHTMEISNSDKTWLATYKPLLIIFAFITGISLISAYSGAFDGMLFMRNFMAAFFITFSFFKFLDLKGFADSYSSYDLLAKKIYSYGYVYPFFELFLGLAYLTGFNMEITGIATIGVMGFSSIGVIQAVVNKQQIKCACLGTVFNLPMTTVTIIEDLLMVVMAVFMLII